MKRRKSKKAPKPSKGAGGTDVTFNTRHNDHGNQVENGHGSHSTYDTTKLMPQNGSAMHGAPAYSSHPANATTAPPSTVGLASHGNTSSNGYHVTNGAPEMVQHVGSTTGQVQATHGTGAGNNVPAIVQPVARY